MEIITSWDDGHPLDFKLADILEKYEIPAIFYIPIKNQDGSPILPPQEIYKLSKRFAIGGHTYNHIKLTQVSLQKANQEIVDGKNALEDIIQKQLHSFSYPCGFYNNDIINLVKDAGFKESRSARLINFKQSKDDDFVKHPNLHIYPHKTIIDILHCTKQKDIYSLKKRFESVMYNHIDLCSHHNFFPDIKTMHIWGHSWEIEKYNLWSKLENILKGLQYKESLGY